ncbi:putative aminoadipate reductase [Laetiporus sulphureus 93-53]|uniref:Putative aminoadipate reductase n=1 Tax=Laetiporus sulphureus 93-53 TaxID=1314785 RepID=A0A165DVU9_9APHY|nr:putative aminoadipate reductase [Laetiporus sulphureus 93-53]KZT05734.1 putative aminoadipate reductase [Laetiporus sulphureus 93-53]
MAVIDMLLCPPLDGTVSVLPGFLDFHAHYNPTVSLFELVSDDEHNDDATISFQQFAHATHRIAHIFHPLRPSSGRIVVALLISSDGLLHHALLVGLIRAGIIPFPMMPRNSAPAIISMLERTDCHHIISQPAFAPLIAAIRSTNTDYIIHLHDLPAISAIFPELIQKANATVPEPYPLSQLAVAPLDIVFYLHSSGSTGLPKPIPLSQRDILSWCCSSSHIDARDHGLHWGAMSLPAFHMLGIIIGLFTPLMSGRSSALFLPRAHRSLPPVIPTPENTITAARHAHIDILMVVPTFLEAWAKDDGSVRYLSSLSAVTFSGGPVSNASGTRLAAAGVNLYSIYGGTEFGAPVRIFDLDDDPHNIRDAKKKTRLDWNYMQFYEKCMPRWVPEVNGLYELQLLSCPGHSLSVENLPNGECGYATSDLWEPHPSKPGLWRIVGRKDDIIVLSTGEKVSAEQERTICSSPMVGGALMFGRGHAHLGVLVEPHPSEVVVPQDESALAKLRNALWPYVEEANRMMPAFARIYKEMILVTDPSRPLVRAGKGTVIRAPSLALYETEIEALYKAVEESSNLIDVESPRSWTESEVAEWLAIQATSVNNHHTVTKSKDLFEQGFDSLSATLLRNRIIGALSASSDVAANTASREIHSDFVFSYPTIGELAAAISNLVNPGSPTRLAVKSPVQHMTMLIQKHAADLTPAPNLDDVDGAGRRIIMITGTTGTLGAHVLAASLVDERVARIIAVNRGSSLLERHRKAFEAARLPLDILSNKKLSFLGCDFDQDDLGLDCATVKELRSTVTHVVHSAWRLDFNLSLSSFEGHISAVVRLMKTLPRAHLIFTSSVSAVQSWNISEQGLSVPEVPIEDPTVAIGTGYGMSKYVVEQILSKASNIGWHTTTVRIGQICGSVETGAWKSSEWVPSLLKSSIALGCLPIMEGTVSWIPMPAVALSVIDVVMTEKYPVLVNLSHPRPTPSHDVFHAFNSALGLGLPFVSMERWVLKLEQFAKRPSAKDISDMPGIKLLDFFRALTMRMKQTKDAQTISYEMGGLPLLATSEASQLCPTVRDLRPLCPEYATAWVKFWRNEGFIV